MARIAQRPTQIETDCSLDDRSIGPLRILKVAPTSFFADYGCHVRILEEALALQSVGDEVLICTYPQGNDVADIRLKRSFGLPGGQTIRVGSSRHKFYLDALLLLKVVQSVAAFRPRVIHAHLHEGALIGLLASKISRIPLVFDFQGSLTAEMIDHGFLTANSRFYQPLRRLEHVLNHSSNAIITSTTNAAEMLVRDFGCRADRVFSVPDAVNADRFRPWWEMPEADRRALRTALGVPPGRKVLVYLGLLAEYQGISHLLRAVAHLVPSRPDIHLLLMGFPGQERYQGLANDLGIRDRVSFTGRVPYERAARYLSVGDVAVAPKLSSTEGNGKLLNYMAVGLPTVVFDSPVNREILGDAGFYAPAGDIIGLAACLDQAFVDATGPSGELGRQLRCRAEEQFSWSQAVGRIRGVYSQILGLGAAHGIH